MKTFDGYGRGTMPDINGGRVAFSPSNTSNQPLGVEVWEGGTRLFKHGGSFRGDPSLSPSGRYVGYFHDADRLRVVYIATGEVVLDLPVSVGIHPIRLSDVSAVYQTRDGLFEAFFSGGTNKLQDYEDKFAQGLAYLTGAWPGYVFTDDNRFSIPGMLKPSQAGDCTIGEHPDSGLVVRIGNREERWYAGEAWNDPRVCQESQDRYAFVAWSPGGTVRVVTDLTAADLAAPPDPVEPPEPSDTILIEPFEHTFWHSVFYLVGKHQGDTPKEFRTGNAILLVEKEGDPSVLLDDLENCLPLGQPMIVQGDVQPLPVAAHNQTVAFWTYGANVDQLGAHVRTCLEQDWQVPVVAYLDRGWTGGRPDWMTDRVRPASQAYRRAGESIDAFESRIEDDIRHVVDFGLPWCLTPRFDDPDQAGTAWTVDDILECMFLYERWVRVFQPAYFMPFSGMRGHGIEHFRKTGDDRLYQWSRAFQYAVPCGRPGRYDNFSEPETPEEKLTIVENKMAQSRRLKTIEPWLEHDMLDAMRAYYGETEPPEPEPGPEPIPGVPESILPTVEAVWDKTEQELGHPPTHEDRGRMLNEIAWIHRNIGWGMSAKPNGANVDQPHTGTKIAHDILQNRLYASPADLWDCYNDQGPIWSQANPHNDPEGRPWVAPVKP